MSTVRVVTGDTEEIRARFVDDALAGVIGLSPTVLIWRVSDGQFWNGAGYQVAPAPQAMAAVDATNLPGVYAYPFDTSAGASSEEHGVLASTTSSAVINPAQEGSIHVGEWVDTLLADTDSLRDHTEGRRRIDQTPDPHQEVVHRRTGSRSGAAGTELQRWDLADQSGAAINDANPMPDAPPSAFDRDPA